MCCEKYRNSQGGSMGRLTLERASPLCVEKVIGVINQQLRTEFNLH